MLGLGVVKLPATYSLVGDTASAVTAPFIPERKANQVLPFHLATFAAGTFPAMSNAPPTYKSDPETASAETRPLIPETQGRPRVAVPLGNIIRRQPPPL